MLKLLKWTTIYRFDSKYISSLTDLIKSTYFPWAFSSHVIVLKTNNFYRKVGSNVIILGCLKKRVLDIV